MRIFIAGATGVLGRNLIPKLLNHGHSVIGTSSTKARLRELQQLGSVLMDGIDRDSVFAAVSSSTPDVVVNEMTAISKVRNYRNFDLELSDQSSAGGRNLSSSGCVEGGRSQKGRRAKLCGLAF